MVMIKVEQWLSIHCSIVKIYHWLLERKAWGDTIDLVKIFPEYLILGGLVFRLQQMTAPGAWWFIIFAYMYTCKDVCNLDTGTMFQYEGKCLTIYMGSRAIHYTQR